MSETHELRLKINAAAARAGAREFVAAINSIKTSIRQLDRDSNGVFTKLKKNLQDAARGGRVKLNIVDRTSLRNLESYARLAQQTIRSTGNTSRSVSNLTTRMTALSGAYGAAKGQAEAYAGSVARLNQQLTRQAALAASSARQGSTAASSTATVRSAASRDGSREAVASQERIQRAVEQTRLSVERLNTQLMRVGGFQSINHLGRAFRDFQRSASDGFRSSSDFTRAQNTMRSAITSAATSLTTLNAKARDQARAEREATSAKKAKTQALLQASSATRSAEMETARLIERLRAVGDSRGIESVSQALIRFRSQISSAGTDTQKLKLAVSSFNDTTSKLKINLIAAEGAKTRSARAARALAKEENDAAAAARKLERDMRSAAGAASASSRAFRNATGGLRGLENAFNGSFQAASLFRTALGSITLGTFVSSVFTAGDALEQFSITMEVASGSVKAAASDLSFIDSIAADLGTNLAASRDAFSKFAVSSDIAGVSGEQTRMIFESVSTAMAVLGRGTEDQRLAFLALEQMMSKGVISAEELRRQLGERLPGAVSLMAKAVGVSVGELQDMLKAGELISSEVLPKFAAELDRTFGSQLSRTFNRAGSNLGRLQVEFTKILEIIGNSGFMDELSEQFRDLTSLMRSNSVREAAERIGRGLADAARIAGDSVQWLVSNIEEIGTVVKNVIGGIIIAQFARMGQAVFLGAQQTVVAVKAFQALKTEAIQTSAALTAVGRSANNAAANTQRLSAATLTAATSGGRIGATFGALGRIFGLLGGPVGIAISALTLVPLLLSSVGSEAEAASAEYDAAMQRMGQSTFFFLDRAKEVEKINPFEQLTANIPLIAEAQKEIAKFRLDSDLDSTINEEIEKLISLVPSVSTRLNDLRDSLGDLRANTDLEKNAKQIADIKKEIVSLISATSEVEGAFSSFRALDKALLPGTRAILLVNDLMEENKEIAGEDAQKLQEYSQEIARLGEEMVVTADKAVEGLFRLSHLLGNPVFSGEFIGLRAEFENIAETFNGTTESAELTRAKLDQLSAKMTEIANDDGLSNQQQRAADAMLELIDKTLEEISALESLRAASDSAASGQAALAGQVANAAGEMAAATSAAFAYANALNTMGDARRAAEATSAETASRRDALLEVAKLRASGDRRGAAVLQDQKFGDTSRAVKKLTENLNAAKAAQKGLVAQIQKTGAVDSQLALAAAGAEVAKIEKLINEEREKGAAITGQLFDLRNQKRGGGGRRGRSSELSERKKLTESMQEYLATSQKEIVANQLLAEGRVKSAKAAEFMAEAIRLGIDVSDAQTAAIFKQVEAVETLRDAMERLARDPVNEWMKSVPSWIEAGRMIEENAIKSLSSSISEFLKTGTFDIKELARNIIGAAIDIVADKAVKSLVEMLGGNTSGSGIGGFGLGNFLGDTLGSVDESNPLKGMDGTQAVALQNALSTGGTQAAQLIQNAMIQAGQSVATTLRGGQTVGGQQAATAIQTAHTAGGGQAGAQIQAAHSTGGATSAAQQQTAHATGGARLAKGVVQGAQQGAPILSKGVASGAGGASVGGGGGLGIFGSLLSFLMFSEGGISSSPTAVNSSVIAPASLLTNAPSFARGTANVSGGIPAMLHENEAVVPLSGGRKIPVELNDSEDGEGRNARSKTTVVQNIRIETPNIHEFNNSQAQISNKLNKFASRGRR